MTLESAEAVEAYWSNEPGKEGDGILMIWAEALVKQDGYNAIANAENALKNAADQIKADGEDYIASEAGWNAGQKAAATAALNKLYADILAGTADPENVDFTNTVLNSGKNVVRDAVVAIGTAQTAAIDDIDTAGTWTNAELAALEDAAETAEEAIIAAKTEAEIKTAVDGFATVYNKVWTDRVADAKAELAELEGEVVPADVNALKTMMETASSKSVVASMVAGTPDINGEIIVTVTLSYQAFGASTATTTTTTVPFVAAP